MNREPLDALLKKSRECLDACNYAACAEIARHALQWESDNPDALALLQTARRKEDERLQAELESHNLKLKQEAQILFEEEQYAQCLSLLSFLHELDPEDASLNDRRLRCSERLRALGINPDQTVNPPEIYPLPEAGNNQPPVPASDLGALAVFQTESGVVDSLLQEPLDESAGQPHPFPTEGQSPAPIHTRLRNLFSGGSLGLPLPPGAWKRWLILGGMVFVLAVVILLLFKMPGSGWHSKQIETSFGTLQIQSVPADARVIVNGVDRGVTPLQIDPVIPGNYEIRMEKEGFKPLVRHLPVNRGENANLSIQLEPISSAAGEGGVRADSLRQEEIRRLFAQGKLPEANRECEIILAADPQNEFAHQLKQGMKDQIQAQVRTALQDKQWDKARDLIKFGLVVVPGDEELRKMGLMLPTEKRGDGRIEAVGPSPDRKKSLALQRQIQEAFLRGNLFPPSSGNAWDLLLKFQTLSPNDSFVVEKKGQLLAALISQINAAQRARKSGDAREKLAWGLTQFPGDPRLKGLERTLKQASEESRKPDEESGWLQKAEEAMSSSRYLQPAQESVLAYCNQVLSVNPRHPKALQLKSEAISRALAQARAHIETGAYEEAAVSFQLFVQLAATEKNWPIPLSEMKDVLMKLSFTSQEVIHDHAMGKCNGSLKFNGYSIAYNPVGKSKDGFTRKLVEITTAEGGEKLKIQFPDKTYRFSVDAGSNREESRRQTEDLSRKFLLFFRAIKK